MLKKTVANIKIMRVLAKDAYAKIENREGKIRRVEFSYGSGYLSQSSRILKIDSGTRSVEIVDYEGRSRKVKL